MYRNRGIIVVSNSVHFAYFLVGTYIDFITKDVKSVK